MKPIKIVAAILLLTLTAGSFAKTLIVYTQNGVTYAILHPTATCPIIPGPGIDIIACIEGYLPFNPPVNIFDLSHPEYINYSLQLGHDGLTFINDETGNNEVFLDEATIQAQFNNQKLIVMKHHVGENLEFFTMDITYPDCVFLPFYTDLIPCLLTYFNTVSVQTLLENTGYIFDIYPNPISSAFALNVENAFLAIDPLSVKLTFVNMSTFVETDFPNLSSGVNNLNRETMPEGNYIAYIYINNVLVYTSDIIVIVPE